MERRKGKGSRIMAYLTCLKHDLSHLVIVRLGVEWGLSSTGCSLGTRSSLWWEVVMPDLDPLVMLSLTKCPRSHKSLQDS